MCGITGLIDCDRPIDEGVLTRMRDALRHRGPDEAGIWTNTNSPAASAPFVGLGIRRLSIIDLPGGHQPITNEDGTICLVFNGEIYNFRELREELLAQGHQFKTHCDTETIVHLYEQHGVECLGKLNGMFAFAIWDANQQTLFCARDRIGEKPFYYAEPGRQFLFASEPKALLEHPSMSRRELNQSALSKYLLHEYVPWPECIFQGVKKLPPASWLIWKAGRVTTGRYWEMQFPAAGSARKDEQEYARELVDRFRKSVSMRLVSDVPLGVFLSGGIDSSSVVAAMAELVPPRQIKTFSIGFTEETFDESRYARRVAEHFGTDHHEQILSAGKMADLLPEVARFLDEPFGDASIVPTYMLSRFTRQHVTVALGGDGGDELFAGYPSFKAHRIAELCRLPESVRRALMQASTDLLPTSTKNFSLRFQLQRFLSAASEPAEVRHNLWLGSFHPRDQAELLAFPVEAPHEQPPATSPRDLMQFLIELYVKTYLTDDILTKTDRASMACSLEVRSPFLDHTFIEFVNAIPSDLKLKGFTSKYILKKAMSPQLPRGIAHRKKKGFGIPVSAWLRGPLREMAGDLLSPARIRNQGLFNPACVSRLLESHLSGKSDARKQLWTLLMFQLWYENYLRAPAPMV